MSLEEYILTYVGVTDKGEEGIVCNIADYYERYIKPLDKRFSEYNLYSNRTVICPLHDDTDPSFGLINHRFYSGVKIYHCFGCGASGTIIRLHQLIQDKYHNIKLTDEEACKSLADLFEIDLSDFEEVDTDDYTTKYNRIMKKICNSRGAYTSKVFHDTLLALRQSELSDNDKMNALGTESIKMIATQKKLYS